MFSSNQKFSVSCEEKQFPGVLALALDMRLSLVTKPTLTYQLTADGKFAIGWGGEEKGWQKFPFDFPSNEMLVAMIKQFISTTSPLHKIHLEDEDFGDGSTHPGYLVEVIPGNFAPEWNGIKNPCYGILYIRRFNCFYHK